jgi:hypothetical protein
MVLGIMLLAVYLGARIQGAILSRAAILSFNAPENLTVMLPTPPRQQTVSGRRRQFMVR